MAVVIDGTDLAGFERAADLFPIRTGTTMPDFGTPRRVSMLRLGPVSRRLRPRVWMKADWVSPPSVVISSEQAWKAAGGLLAAGFWAFDWTYSDASGYLR